MKQSNHPHRQNLIVGRVAILTLFVFVVTTVSACYSWHVSTANEVSSLVKNGGQGLSIQYVDKLDIKRDFLIYSIQHPYMHGRHVDKLGSYLDKREVRINMDNVGQILVQKYSHGKTAGLILGLVGGVALVALLVFSAVLAASCSCPHVFLKDGKRNIFIGETFPGAAFHSIQRDDLLEFPTLPPGAIQIYLENHGKETQYTDQLKMMLVDHIKSSRVVAGPKATLLSVGQPVAPVVVRTLQGKDVTSLLQKQDKKSWQSNLVELTKRKQRHLREGLELSFPMPKVGSKPVLELKAKNTRWAATVFAHYFALSGKSYAQHMAASNHPSAGPRILRWLEREGVKLTVEMRKKGQWEKVAVTQLVGPEAARRLVVPLPVVAANAKEKVLKVRVSGATGFWEFDWAGLSTQTKAKLRVHRVSSSVAKTDDGNDQRKALAKTDGNYVVTTKKDEKIHLTFKQPKLVKGWKRSAFLFSHGYYNVHQRKMGKPSLGTLRTIQVKEGSLARFGLDLYQKYLEKLHATAKKPLVFKR